VEQPSSAKPEPKKWSNALLLVVVVVVVVIKYRHDIDDGFDHDNDIERPQNFRSAALGARRQGASGGSPRSLPVVVVIGYARNDDYDNDNDEGRSRNICTVALAPHHRR